MKKKSLIILGIVFGGLMIAPPILISFAESTGIKLTLLHNEGVMIEVSGIRIYIDPSYIPGQYDSKYADVVCVTHEHTDHYITPVIDELQKDDTINIFPASMSAAIAAYDGIGVVPEQQIVISDDITITAFYMYSKEAYHPPSANWTSYLINIDGFVIFHAGDATNITEYQQLTGLVDLAMLPHVTNFLMTHAEIVDTINTIQPRYAMLFHENLEAYRDFYESYKNHFEATFLLMDHFTSRTF